MEQATRAMACGRSKSWDRIGIRRPTSSRRACSLCGQLLGFLRLYVGLGARVQHTTVIAFNDRVELLAETTPIVDYQELLGMAVET